MRLDLIGAETTNEREPASLVLWVERIDQAQQAIGIEAWAALEADRVLDAAAVFDVRVIGLARESPIQSIWPEVAYQSPLVESSRVIACS